MANVESLTYARERNEARFKEGRIDIVEVDQARQRELQAENQLIVATQSSARLLDNFKNLIGLPVYAQGSIVDVTGAPVTVRGAPAHSVTMTE